MWGGDISGVKIVQRLFFLAKESKGFLGVRQSYSDIILMVYDQSKPKSHKKYHIT